jgi:hypothetical protein
VASVVEWDRLQRAVAGCNGLRRGIRRIVAGWWTEAMALWRAVWGFRGFGLCCAPEVTSNMGCDGAVVPLRRPGLQPMALAGCGRIWPALAVSGFRC